MAIESEEDLAGFFDGKEFAEAVTYTPVSGDPSSPTIIVGSGDELFGAGLPSLSAASRVALVRKSEIALPVKGDTITRTGGEVLKVQGHRSEDYGAVWILDLAK